MSDVDLDYLMSIKYSSNLDEVLRANKSLVSDHEKFLKSLPLRLAYDINDKELVKKLADMEQKLKQFVINATNGNAAPQSGVLGGVATQTQREAAQIQGLLERTEKIVKAGKKRIEEVTEKYQMSDGSILTNVRRGKDFQSTKTTSRDREQQLIRDLRSGRMSDVQRELDQATGSSNTTRQLQLLRERMDMLRALQAQYNDIASSPAFRKVESGIQRTGSKIDSLSGSVSASLDKQRERDMRANREKDLVQNLSSGRLADLGQQINFAQGANDTVKQVALLRERLELLRQLSSQYNDIAGSAAFRKVEAGVERTQARIQNLTGRAGASIDRQREKEIESNRKAFFDEQNRNARQQMDVSEKSYKQSRMALQTSKASVQSAAELQAVQQKIADLDANRVLSLERSAQQYRAIAAQAKQMGNNKEFLRTTTLADNFERQALSLRNALGGEKNKQFVDAERRAMEDEFRLAKQRLATEEQIYRTELKRARAIEDIAQRNAAVDAAVKRQRDALLDFSRAAKDLSDRANLRGFTPLANQAKDKSFTAGLKADDVLNQTARATSDVGKKASGASKSIAGLASTFTQWYVASSLVTGAMRTLGVAIDGVISVDRQFAVLKTIFQGTAEEAQLLKRNVLDLAVANGRSGDEALAAATSFARLGLSRVQINKLVETSLIAANVAEISSADAAEKLTALMQQYKLSVDEVAAALGRLNSISNTQNVTVGQLLSNISLTASVARQAGIALEDLEGIIGVTIASTKATSSEIGNAIKFVLQRLRKPETLDALKLEFDIDLTKANGDLREGTEILRELARIYPLLGKAEQSRLLDLAAGTRQASRFATVLETFNRAQNVTANAVGDTNSALRENENITQSLASKLQGLETAWTSFAVSLGDSGLLDQVAEKVSDLADVIMAAKELVEDSNGNDGRDARGNRRDIEIKSNRERAALDRLNDNVFNPTVFDQTSFSQQELESFRKLLPLIDEYGRKMRDAQASGDMSASAQAIIDFQNAAKKIGVDISRSDRASNLLNLGGGDLNTAEAAINRLIPEKKRNEAEASLTLARGQLEQFQRGAANAADQADNLREQINQGLVDPKRVLSDFDSFRNVMTELDGGTAMFADSLSKVNEAIDAGDYQAVVSEIEKLRSAFLGAVPGAAQNFNQMRDAQVTELQKQIQESINARKKLEQDGAEPSRILKAMDETKALQDQLNDARKKANEITVEPINPRRQANITSFFEALKTRSDEIARAFREVEAGENTNSANLTFARDSSQNFVAIDQVTRSLNATIAEAEAAIAAIPANATNRNELVKHQQDLISSAKTRLVEETKIAEQQDRQNRLMVEANRIRDGARRGRNEFAIFDAGLGAGTNPTEKLADQLRGGTEFFRSQAWRDALSPPRTAQDLAASSSIMLASQEANQSRLLALRIRENEIQKDLRQAAQDMIKAEKERTEQVSKRLAMASREEQLIAAALSATIRAGGPLTEGEFMGLSQRTRQVADGFVTNGNPFAAGDSPRAQYQRIAQDLDQELAKAKTAIADYSVAVQKSQAYLEKQFGVGGRYAPASPDGIVPAAQNAIANQPRQGGVVLNANGTVLNIELSRGFDALRGVLTAELENRINREFETIRQTIRRVTSRPVEPDIGPAMSVSPP